MSEKNLIQSVQQALAVEEWLASQALLEWKTLEQVSVAVMLIKDKVYRILKTLAAAGRVEEGDKGWRISPKLVLFAFRAIEYFKAEAGRFGLKEQ